MDIKCTLEEKVSKKGNPYTVLVVHLTPTCSKQVFLEPAELELLKMQKDTNNNDFPEFLR
ncbi:MAG: hypothetical protein E7168_01445 [Firmicutes bacterium]|nr:hypothetical protein [Bacillota bacterium]